MSFVFCVKIIVRLRVKLDEELTVGSPLLVRESRGKLVPLTDKFMTRMDKQWAPELG